MLGFLARQAIRLLLLLSNHLGFIGLDIGILLGTLRRSVAVHGGLQSHKVNNGGIEQHAEREPHTL